MAQPAPAQPVTRHYYAGSWPVSRLFMIVAVILFVIASLMAGDVLFKGDDYLPWMLGGFASVALSWAV
jgi:hypothetical protein